jgi:hypothetical protein
VLVPKGTDLLILWIVLVPKGTDLLIFVFVVLYSFTSIGYNTNHYCQPANGAEMQVKIH